MVFSWVCVRGIGAAYGGDEEADGDCLLCACHICGGLSSTLGVGYCEGVGFAGVVFQLMGRLRTASPGVFFGETRSTRDRVFNVKSLQVHCLC